MMTQMEPHRAAREIIDTINNDQPYYKQKMLIFENLEKKEKKGTYNKNLAPKSFKNLTDKTRMDWNKRYSADQEEVMTAKGSRIADLELTHDFEVDCLENEKHKFFKFKGNGTVQTGKF